MRDWFDDAETAEVLEDDAPPEMLADEVVAPVATPASASARDEPTRVASDDRTRIAPAAPPSVAAAQPDPVPAARRRFLGDRPRLRSWLINGTAIVVLLVIGALVAEFAPIGRGGGGGGVVTTLPNGDPILPDDTTTTTAEPLDTTTTTAVETTTTTTEPPVTTTTEPVTLPAIGEPIPLDELTMGVDVLGPLTFGDDGEQVVGRLVATFDQPDEDSDVTTSAGEFGTCAGDLIRYVRWGSLLIVNTVDDQGTETFGGYRVDLDYHGAPAPADALATISGLSPGDTVADLESTYSSFTIDYVDSNVGTAFELRASDGSLLLWGPVTSTDGDGLVRGIYAPDVCGR